MKGLIIVQEAGADDHDDMMTDELMVTITDSEVLGGTQVELEFSELHVNYEIIATQNGEEIFSETAHAMEHTATHQIDAVGSDANPIDIEIVSIGIGIPGNEADWTGPTGTVAEQQVVPEFGTIAMMVLAVAIISIVAVTAKSRVVPRF
jgi:predicted secreted protein with PEFG-CTERM motif